MVYASIIEGFFVFSLEDEEKMYIARRNNRVF